MKHNFLDTSVYLKTGFKLVQVALVIRGFLSANSLILRLRIVDKTSELAIIKPASLASQRLYTYFCGKMI